jgi:hypothetical protein
MRRVDVCNTAVLRFVIHVASLEISEPQTIGISASIRYTPMFALLSDPKKKRKDLIEAERVALLDHGTKVGRLPDFRITLWSCAIIRRGRERHHS